MMEQKPVVDENDPSVQIRTDLWPTMNVVQLTRQRELLLDKASMMQGMIDGMASPSIINMYMVLQVGLQDINKLIEYKASQRR